MWGYSFFPIVSLIIISLLEITGLLSSDGSVLPMLPTVNVNRTCCNGILGYAVPYKTMPCAEMRCCNSDETVALQKVNHALGYCFRCVPQSLFQKKPNLTEPRCYTNGENVASTNSTSIEYSLRTCCQGLKFSIVTYSDDVALTIRCVQSMNQATTRIIKCV